MRTPPSRLESASLLGTINALRPHDQVIGQIVPRRGQHAAALAPERRAIAGLDGGKLAIINHEDDAIRYDRAGDTEGKGLHLWRYVHVHLPDDVSVLRAQRRQLAAILRH